MKSISIILHVIFLFLCLVVCANTAFSQDSEAEVLAPEGDSARPSADGKETNAQPKIVNELPGSGDGEWNLVNEYDWKNKSTNLQVTGWSLTTLGVISMIASASLLTKAEDICGRGYDDEMQRGEAEYYTMIGVSVGIGGIGLIIGGAIPLIVDYSDHSEYFTQKERSRFYIGYGIASLATGIPFLINGSIIQSHHGEDWGISLLTIGSLATVTGVVLLILNAVTREEEDTKAFHWRPDVYLSPEMAGFGISGRF